MGRLRLRRFEDTSLFTIPVKVGLLADPKATRDAQLLLDTGASTLFATESLVTSLGAEVGEPRFDVGGLAGPARLSSVSDLKLVIGSGGDERTIRLARVPVLPRSSAVPAMADGVLGAFPLHLLRATATIDYDTLLATLEWP